MNKSRVCIFFVSSILLSLFTPLANADDCASWFCYDGTNWKGSWETGAIVGGFNGKFDYSVANLLFYGKLYF